LSFATKAGHGFALFDDGQCSVGAFGKDGIRQDFLLIVVGIGG